MIVSTKNSQVYLVEETTETLLPNLTNFTLHVERSLIDVSVLSTEWARSTVGSASATGSMTIGIDPDDPTIKKLQTAQRNGVAVKLKFYEQGKAATGSNAYVFTAYLGSWNSDVGVNQALTAQVSFTVDGEIKLEAVA